MDNLQEDINKIRFAAEEATNTPEKVGSVLHRLKQGNDGKASLEEVNKTLKEQESVINKTLTEKIKEVDNAFDAKSAEIDKTFKEQKKEVDEKLEGVQKVVDNGVIFEVTSSSSTLIDVTSLFLAKKIRGNIAEDSGQFRATDRDLYIINKVKLEANTNYKITGLNFVGRVGYPLLNFYSNDSDLTDRSYAIGAVDDGAYTFTTNEKDLYMSFYIRSILNTSNDFDATSSIKVMKGEGEVSLENVSLQTTTGYTLVNNCKLLLNAQKSTSSSSTLIDVTSLFLAKKIRGNIAEDSGQFRATDRDLYIINKVKLEANTNYKITGLNFVGRVGYPLLNFYANDSDLTDRSYAIGAVDDGAYTFTTNEKDLYMSFYIRFILNTSNDFDATSSIKVMKEGASYDIYNESGDFIFNTSNTNSGTIDTSTTDARKGYFTVYPEDFDGDTIDDKISSALAFLKGANGGNIIFKSPIYIVSKAIVIPSNVHVYLDSCTIKLADQVFDNVFRSDSLEIDQSQPNGYCTKLNKVENIKIIGRNGAKIEGADNFYTDVNPRTGKTEKWAGDLFGWRSILVLFVYVDTFEVGNLKLEKAHNWTTLFSNGCNNGWIHDLRFQTDGVPNGDGVACIQGLTNTIIENISGTTGDDTVGLANFNRSRFNINGRNVFPLLPVDYEDYSYGGNNGDSFNVTVRNVNTNGFAHGLIFLPSSPKIYNIKIDNIQCSGGKTGTVKMYGNGSYGDGFKDGNVYDVFINNIGFDGNGYALIMEAPLYTSWINKVKGKINVKSGVDNKDTKFTNLSTA